MLHRQASWVPGDNPPRQGLQQGKEGALSWNTLHESEKLPAGWCGPAAKKTDGGKKQDDMLVGAQITHTRLRMLVLLGDMWGSAEGDMA